MPSDVRGTACPGRFPVDSLGINTGCHSAGTACHARRPADAGGGTTLAGKSMLRVMEQAQAAGYLV